MSYISYIFNIYIYTHIWYGGMCISNTNDNVWHWWCYRSLLLFPLLCCWCHSLAPQDQAPFPPTSQLNYKYDCWWSSWCEVTSWLHDFIRQKKYVSDWSRELWGSVSGSRWKVSSGLIFPNQRCDNLILRSPLIWKVWSWRWVAIHKHDPQAERVRGQSKIQGFVGETMGKLRCIYYMYISLKEFQDEWPWTGVWP